MQPLPGQISARDAVRTRAEIEAGIAQLRVTHERMLELALTGPVRDPGDTYTLGQISCLEWVLGIAELTPLSCRAGIDGSDPREIDREHTYAEDMLYRRVPMDRRGGSYVSAVDFTLLWARYQATSDGL